MNVLTTAAATVLQVRNAVLTIHGCRRTESKVVVVLLKRPTDRPPAKQKVGRASKCHWRRNNNNNNNNKIKI